MSQSDVAFAKIPPHLQETLAWLVKVDELKLADGLGRTIARFLPPGDPESSDFLAYALFRAKSYRDAADAALRTLDLVPHSPEAAFNAARCVHAAGDPVRAERLVRTALARRPQWPDARIELAVFVCAQGRFDEAKAILHAVERELAPETGNAPIVRFNLGWHELRHGNFKAGMQALRIGRQLKIWGAQAHRYSQPMLAAGESVCGKTVLLCGEGGFGDEMIAARFAQLITARGGQAIWVTEKALGSLLARVPGVLRVVTPDAVSSLRYDRWAPCMDLPVLLDLDLHEVPSAPYLSADPRVAAVWAERMPRRDGLRIGLRWQGNARYEQDLMRSVPFALLQRLLDTGGATFYSLQRDEGAEELRHHPNLIDLGPELRTWEDTAGALANLDLVVSSCTSVPHLAAAMGRPVWVLCPITCYYIWALPGERSPWYQDVRLFRQTRQGSWDGPVDAVRHALTERLGGS